MKYSTILPSNKRVAEARQALRQPRGKKAKTSISLSHEVILAIDSIAGAAQRSAFIERAVRHYVKAIVRRVNREHDLAAINAGAAITNRESDQLLSLQAWPK